LRLSYFPLPFIGLFCYLKPVTITLCNGKGGSGKTTLTILLGSAMAEAGHHVGILDTDPQKTATRWIEEIGGLTLFEEGKAYTAVLIDTPPRLECQEFTDAVSRADITIVVSSPSPADLFTSRDTVAVLEQLGAKGRAHLLFNQVQAGTILSRELEEMAERIGLPTLKNRMQRRQVYQHAVLMGWPSLGPEARAEVLRIALEITDLAKVAK
jgi:chromosome partitioning protein